MRLMITALLLTVASPVFAQPAQIAAVTEPDPARLAAATRLVEVVMPPALRELMIEQSSGPMLDSLGKAMMNSPQMALAFAKEPRARPVFERFLAAQAAETRGMMRDMMPAMIRIMARSYARQLTVAQMVEARDFYATSSGQAFAIVGATVMSDPEFAGVMQQALVKSMATMPAKSKALVDEINALGPATDKNSPND